MTICVCRRGIRELSIGCSWHLHSRQSECADTARLGGVGSVYDGRTARSLTLAVPKARGVGPCTTWVGVVALQCNLTYGVPWHELGGVIPKFIGWLCMAIAGQRTRGCGRTGLMSRCVCEGLELCTMGLLRRQNCIGCLRGDGARHRLEAPHLVGQGLPLHEGEPIWGGGSGRVHSTPVQGCMHGGAWWRLRGAPSDCAWRSKQTSPSWGTSETFG